MVAVFRYICVMVYRLLCFFLFFFASNMSFSQIDTAFVDTKYFEDQFYFALNYNGLHDRPNDFETNTLSGGLMLGYIRDIPFNKRRNVGVGVGLGYSYNNYRQNMQIEPGEFGNTFEVRPYEDFQTNRFAIHLLELPLELRWRTSTATKYSFWRIYVGVKFGYIFYSKEKSFSSGEEIILKNIESLENLRYGISLSAGYGSLNFNIYYGLNNLFKEGSETILGESIEIKQLNIGLIFYIL
jgi:hypothetical protein